MLRTIKLYEQLSLFEASADFKQELADLSAYLKKTKDDLDSEVISLVANLHKQLTNEKLPNRTGFFGGIHQWWKNLWGRNDKKNPYYWQNRIGALGRTDLDPPTVEEYRMLKVLADSLEEAVASTPTPLVTKILTQWSGRLRGVLIAHMDNMIARVNKIAGDVKGTPIANTPPDTPIANTPPDTPIANTPPEKKPEKKPKPALEVPDETDEATYEEAKKAWLTIKGASRSIKYGFLKLWNANKFAEAIAYAKDIVAKGLHTQSPTKPADPSSTKSARMGDDEPVVTKKELPPKEKSLDDEAADLGITPDTKTNLGGVFKNLSPRLKKLVIDQCKNHMPDCPVGKAHEDDSILGLSPVEVHKILRKHEGKSVENIKAGKGETIDNEQEREVILAVHKPWLSLTPRERKVYNDDGSGGRPIKSHNRIIGGMTFPFRIPPVLLDKDPRFAILRDYYPEHFLKLGRLRRLQTPDDTPETIARKIKHNIRDGKVSGEFSTEKSEKEAEASPKPNPRPEKRPLEDAEESERKGRRVKNKAPLEALPEDDTPVSLKDMVDDFPKEIATLILDVGKTNEDDARELVSVWNSIKDDRNEVKKGFKNLLKAGEIDQALTYNIDNKEDDDEMKEIFNSNFKPKGPTLLEALKTRLKLQREGKTKAWEPLPKKITPQTLIERLRKQSSKLYQES